jgi:hypothetical protein
MRDRERIQCRLDIRGKIGTHGDSCMSCFSNRLALARWVDTLADDIDCQQIESKG